MNLFRFELFSWFLVFVLIYQGGGQLSVNKSIVATVIVYLVFKLLDLKDAVDPAMQASPVQVAAQAASSAAAEATIDATQNHNAAAQAGQTAALKVEKFLGGYHM
jgi:hypothetical protein